jgi:hypothetical protein
MNEEAMGSSKPHQSPKRTFWSTAWIFLALLGLTLAMAFILKFAAGTLRL